MCETGPSDDERLLGCCGQIKSDGKTGAGGDSVVVVVTACTFEGVVGTVS